MTDDGIEVPKERKTIRRKLDELAHQIADLGIKIDLLTKRIKKTRFYLVLAFFITTGGALYGYWTSARDNILPKIGLGEAVHYKFSLANAVFYSKQFDYKTNTAHFNFNVTLQNGGEWIGDRGRLLIAKVEGNEPHLVAVSALQRSIDNITLSIDMPPTAELIRLRDLPTELLFCAWQVTGKKRVIPLLSRRADEFSNNTGVDHVWPEKKVGYVSYTAIPLTLDTADPLTNPNACSKIIKSTEATKAPECVAFSEKLDRVCGESGDAAN